jgi:hypothetical protein
MSRHGRGRGGRHFLEGLGVGAISIGGAAAAAGATYKFSEFLVKCKRLFDVRSENAVFVRLIERVEIDLAELQRLMALKEVKEALKNNKAKTLWIQAKVKDVNDAIGVMTKYTRKVAKAGWWLGLKTRIWWVLDEHEKLLHREMELGSAREGVLAVIEYLNQFEEVKGKPKEKDSETHRHTSTRTQVDVEVDGERRGRRVTELDYEGRPKREQKDYEYYEGPPKREQRDYEYYEGPPKREQKDYEYYEEDIEMEQPRRPISARDGFYYGQLDGPLSTRPSWWAEQNAKQYAADRDVSISSILLRIYTLI